MTVFVILGIVILVIVVFGLIIYSNLKEGMINADAKKAVTAYLQSDSVNYYVNTCLDTSVSSSVYDLAIQGGVFYDYQNGSYRATQEGATHIPYNISWTLPNGTVSDLYFNVSYSVLNHSYCGIVEKDVPYYPYKNTFVRDLYGVYNNYNVNADCMYDSIFGYKLSGFAGFNNMTRLCRAGSNNTLAIKSGNTGIEFSPCYDSIIFEPNRSIEYILAEQISLRMANCTDFSVFKDDNITVTGPPSTRIIYTSESMLVYVTYNLTVKIKNKEPVFVMHTFKYKSNLRLPRIHNYVMSLLKADSQDFFFNLYDNYKSYGAHNEINPEKFFDPDYMSVRIVNFTDCASCPYSYDRLLIVEDSKSIMGNRNLIYMTVLKNRNPALDFVHMTAPGSYYDIVVSNNQEIILDPYGYDPDDNRNITYIYEGWKETFDEICTFPSPVPGVPISPADAVCNPVQNSGYKNWTSSILFTSTERKANYTTNETDLGPHNVTITVRDTSGLEDYQVVQILVFDLPKAIISPVKIYSTIPENITSIEDNFTLDGSLSTASVYLNGELKGYIWDINRVNPAEWVFRNRTERSILVVPIEYYNQDMNPNTLIQKIKPFKLSTPGMHNVSLIIESYLPQYDVTVQSIPEYMALDVKECIPYENPWGEPPYPYNTGTDPFLANHSCCNQDYTVITSPGYACYSSKKFGKISLLESEDISYNTENGNTLSEYAYPSLPQTTISVNPPESFYTRNDIYEMTFERFCDGNRGNICAGDMRKTLTRVAECRDRMLGQKETCQGPSEAISDINWGCVNYGPGTSFEKTFSLPSADGSPATGTCNTLRVCSNPGPGGYASGGRMLCDAQCSGGDCSYGANCECSRASCNAVCDASPANSYRWQGTVCSSNCALTSTCTFQTNTQMPCSQGNSYCFSATGNFVDYCYHSVACGAGGGSWQTGEYCKTGQRINTNLCYYAPATFNLADRCSATGTCALLVSDRTALPGCPPGQLHVCNANQGWICQ